MSDEPRKRRRRRPAPDRCEWMVDTHYRPRVDQGDETLTVTSSHGPFSCRDAAELYAMNLAGHSSSYRGCTIYRVEPPQRFPINRLHTQN